MVRILIVYHSQTGNTARMAKAVAEGAAGIEGAQVVLKQAVEATLQDLLDCQGLAVGTPENFGYMSGAMKDFFDRNYYAVLERLNGRPYAALVCAGSDGHNAARQIERIAGGWRLKPVAAPLIVCTHAQTPEAILRPKQIGAQELQACREIGAALAAGLVLGVF